MTTPDESQQSALDHRVLHVDHGPVRAIAVRLDRLAGDLEAVAEPREPDVGQHRRVDARLAIPICRPARELSGLLGALSTALYVVSGSFSEADGDAAALSQRLERELR